MRRGQFLPRVECVVEGADDRLFNLGAAELRARRHQGGQVEVRRVAVALGQVDAEDVGPFLVEGEVHVEDFVQAPLAQQLGRQLRDIVGGGHHEHRGALLRKPG